MIRPVGVVLLAAGLASPSVTPAQTREERARLDSIRAGLQSETDTGTLLARERERIAVARVDRDNALLHMELGWVAHRLGELTGARRRYEDAASEFQWAADLRPRWPYAWYWLGLAQLRLGESNIILVENLRQVLGQDALSLAARSFARALEADPGFSDALVDLAQTALRQRISPRLAVAQAALRLAAETPASSQSAVLLARGRIERRLGAQDTALTAFRRFVASGADRALGELEVARTEALAGRPDSAVAAYARAVREPVSDSARSALRRDLVWIASGEELAAFDRLARDSLGPWLASFWERRDVSDARRPGERLVEQFRRYQVAVDRYGLVSRRRAFDVTYAYRDTTQSEFDDRGIIYLRHGEPAARAQHAEPGIEPNESWLYRRPGGAPLIFHFVARGEVQDFRLVESLADVLGADIAVRLQTEPLAVHPPFTSLYSSRSGFSPLYERMARGAANRSTLLASERAAGRRMVREGVTTDSYPLSFRDDLNPVVSWFLVEGPAGRGELHLVFAIPARRLQPAQTDGAVVYPLALRLVVYDTSRSRVAALDTLRVFRSAAALGAGSYLTEQLVLQVPPGRLGYSFVVEELNRGAGALLSGDLEVPRYDVGFEASDLVVGREGSGLLWRRPEGEVPLNPIRQFPVGGTATLWYELYGLPQGASVGTRVRIVRGRRSFLRRLFGGGSGADLAYVTVTDAPGRSRVRQTVALSGLGPGRYLIELELTDPASGRRLVRSEAFEIVARSP